MPLDEVRVTETDCDSGRLKLTRTAPEVVVEVPASERDRELEFEVRNNANRELSFGEIDDGEVEEQAEEQRSEEREERRGERGEEEGKADREGESEVGGDLEEEKQCRWIQPIPLPTS
ncbi:unnamed protein product [Linum trigynum]|uniref:Uncharacterized protein n=1 Tax=Linum trigynum TaxID=586398 RepID=A0AAV2EP70_9ROSI